MEIKAVIFDLDGTVLDNEDEYGTAFRKVLENLGANVQKDFPHQRGIGVKENWPQLLTEYNIKTKKTLEELTRETQAEYLKLLPQVTIKPGIAEFIEGLKENNIQTALATSNAWWIVEEVFDKLNLYPLFNVVTTGEEVEFRKPDPGLFLRTAEKLGVIPRDCLVVEDSEAGIEAAKRAEMAVFNMDQNDGKS